MRIVSSADAFFNAADHLKDIESKAAAFCGDRDISTVDMFAGKGNFAKQCSMKGYASIPIDILLDSYFHDMTSKRGFYFILDIILRVAAWQLLRLSFGGPRPVEASSCADAHAACSCS